MGQSNQEYDTLSVQYIPLYGVACIYLFNVNNKSTTKRTKICSKLTIKTSEGCH